MRSYSHVANGGLWRAEDVNPLIATQQFYQRTDVPRSPFPNDYSGCYYSATVSVRVAGSAERTPGQDPVSSAVMPFNSSGAVGKDFGWQ